MTLQTKLTSREVQILSLISHGLKTREIAMQIHISIPTVETHRRNLFIKMNACNVAQLIRKAFEFGILRSEFQQAC